MVGRHFRSEAFSAYVFMVGALSRLSHCSIVPPGGGAGGADRGATRHRRMAHGPHRHAAHAACRDCSTN